MALKLGEKIGKELISTSKLSIPELGALIEHLNLLLIQMKAKEGIKDGDDSNIVELFGKKHVTTREWYNPGHSSVTESA